MSRVPDGWRVAPLKNLAQVSISSVDKKMYAGERLVRLCNYMDVYSKNYIHADLNFMLSSASEAEIAKFSISEDDVLLTKDSESPRDIGIPALVVEPLENIVCGYHLAILRPKRSTLNGRYLYHGLQTDCARDYFFRAATGSTRFGLSVRGIEGTPIAYPPLPEQKKIAAILSSVDEAIDATQAVIDQTRMVKQGLLQDLLTRGIGHTRFKQTEIGEIPEEWEVKTIGAVATFQGGSQPPRESFIFEYKEGYVRLIQIRDYKTDKYKTYIPKDATKKFCSEENIMIGRYGPPIFQILRGLEGAYNVALIKAIPKSCIMNEFLYYVLKQRDLFYLMDRLSQRSSGQTGVDMDALRSFPVALPLKEEQKAIVDVLAGLDSYSDAVSEKHSSLLQIKRGLMQDLLSGSVRVTTP